MVVTTGLEPDRTRASQEVMQREATVQHSQLALQTRVETKAGVVDGGLCNKHISVNEFLQYY